MENNYSKKTKHLTLCALFTALTAVLSQVVIPIGLVPINLATFSVFCAGALLGAKYGAISQAAYVLLGLAGVPVFHSFSSGIGKIAGPTGGYIIGYVIAAMIVGVILEHYGTKLITIIISMLAGFFTYMTLGTLWYMYIMDSKLVPALMVCVVPFLPGDALKITAAAVLTQRLRPVLSKNFI